MQEKVVIFLDAANSPSWVVLKADSVSTPILHGNNAELQTVAKDREVIVLVPAEEVLLLTVVLPKMNRSRLQQALPFALEEQLIDDVDSLHFSIGDYIKENELAVAITAKSKMDEWCTLLKEWNISPDKMCSAIFGLPLLPSAWHIFLFENAAMVRINFCKGFACDRDGLENFLTLVGTEESEKPENIYLHNFSDTAWNCSFSGLSINEIKEAREGFLVELARNISDNACINLLQGKFATRKSKKIRKSKIWKTLASLMVAWIALLFLYPTVSYFILKQRTHVLEKEIATIYKKNFPHASSMVAPKLRMEEKLQKLSADASQNRLLLLMSYVAKAMNQGVPIKLKSFDFQNNQLTLEITATNSDEFATFSDYLTREGLRVKQQNANLVGEKINATLSIE